MNTYKLYKFLDEHRKSKFDKKVKIAEKLDMSRQSYSNFMQMLEENNPRNSFNKICRILEKLGFEIVIKKKSN